MFASQIGRSIAVEIRVDLGAVWKNVDDDRQGERTLSSCIFEQKLFRLRSGAPPRVLDLFSGCGGLSLGFLRAGFEITASVENDPKAAASHARNFHAGDRRHAEFWQAKFAANVARDRAVREAIAQAGWRVATVWECALRRSDQVDVATDLMDEWLRSNKSQLEIREENVLALED